MCEKEVHTLADHFVCDGMSHQLFVFTVSPNAGHKGTDLSEIERDFNSLLLLLVLASPLVVQDLNSFFIWTHVNHPVRMITIHIRTPIPL